MKPQRLRGVGGDAAGILMEPPDAPARQPEREPERELRLGIAVTTFNRRQMVCAQVAEIRRLTGGAYDLVVCDDGSADGTAAALRGMGEIVISGVNRGIAWNKNRGIFYLMAVCGCDVVILLDDDAWPVEAGWQARWAAAARRFGHANFVFPGMVDGLDAGACTPQSPGVTQNLLGACIAFHRYAWSFVGYMDARFGRYGHEHTEFTNRFLRNGFGGEIRYRGEAPAYYYYVIGGGVALQPVTSTGSERDVEANLAVWQAIQRGGGDLYRPPWADEGQRRDFLAEMRLLTGDFRLALPEQRRLTSFLLE